VLQPYRDLLRLFRKDVVLAENASWLFRVAPYLIFATTWVAAALVPTFATGLTFSGAADLIAEGDYVVGRWEGGGTHTGPAFGDFLAGSLPANTGRKMKFTGTTVLKLKDGKIVEEIGLDDGVAALTQLGLIKTAA
jgi:hypothetical protein